MSQSLVKSSTSRSNKKFRYEKMEIGPDYWFVHQYFLTVRLAWETLVIHVGDIKVDTTKNLEIKVKIPLRK